MRPNRQDCRDMTLFIDQDQTAYLLHSSNWNKTLDISRLTEDYPDVDGFYVSVMIDQEREAPAIIKEQDMYYMVTSGCTGWNYNSALYATSPYLLGKWKLIDNPCEGNGYRETFKGQKYLSVSSRRADLSDVRPLETSKSAGVWIQYSSSDNRKRQNDSALD